jgi:hypothetical protein
MTNLVPRSTSIFTAIARKEAKASPQTLARTDLDVSLWQRRV